MNVKTLYFPKGLYEGEIHEPSNLKQGQGTMYYNDGQIYTGEWKNDYSDGYGIYFMKTSRYEGQFVRGNFHGKCIFYYENHKRYEGKYKLNKKQGCGIQYLPNGDIYDGQFNSKAYNGFGKYYYNNGNLYEGQFVGNLRQGKGKFYDQGCQCLTEGTWKNGVRDGYCTITVLKKNSFYKYFQGQFKQNIPHGIFIAKNRQQNILKGNYVRGILQIPAELLLANGDKYIGKINRINSNFVKDGVVIYKDYLQKEEMKQKYSMNLLKRSKFHRMIRVTKCQFNPQER